MKTILALVFGFGVASANAADLIDSISLDVTLGSRHSAKTYRYKGGVYEYNEKNYGLGITASFKEFAPRNVEVSAGWYENSYNHTSAYVSVTAKHEFRFGGFAASPGITFGYATGYEKTPAKAPFLQATVLPNLHISFRGIGVRVGYIPASRYANSEDGKVPIAVWTLQSSYKF